MVLDSADLDCGLHEESPVRCTSHLLNLASSGCSLNIVSVELERNFLHAKLFACSVDQKWPYFHLMFALGNGK